MVEGLSDPHPRVRWWCISLLDHAPDPRAIAAIEPLLDDPVPRVRRNAAHALGCLACKPEWCGAVAPETVAKLEALAASDENARVRRDASIALLTVRTELTVHACEVDHRSPGGTIGGQTPKWSDGHTPSTGSSPTSAAASTWPTPTSRG